MMLRFIRRLIVVCVLFIPLLCAASPSLHTLLQLVTYVGADYSAAIAQGKVIDEAEYQEMLEFSQQIHTMLTQLPQEDIQANAVLTSLSQTLNTLIVTKANPEDVYNTAQALNKLLIQTYQIEINPTALPTPEKIAQRFQENCASCHGEQGTGDGPLAANLTPRPTNFLDKQHLDQLSVFALYNTINLGVAETAMTSFKDTLSNEDRWGLAFYISGMGVPATITEQGKRLWESSPALRANFSLAQLAATAPKDLAKKYSIDMMPVVYYLLQHPEILENPSPDLWQVTFSYLQQSFQHYQEGHTQQAYDLAIQAYLEGFEGLEPSIDVVDKSLRENLESQMMAYRQLLQQKASFDDVQTVFSHLMTELEQAQRHLQSTTMTWFKIFMSAFIILLREGVEIILVVALVAAMLIKAQRRDALIYVHLGWITALLAGAATWYISHHFLTISGLQRELTEGISALFAAAILLWVGYWLHSHHIAGEWQRFIKEKLGASLSRGSLLGLSGLCFIAVYREMFETILFYETLWFQVGDAGEQSAIYYGFALALIILLGLVACLLRLGITLPIATFFTWSSRLIFVLAVVFIGQGIHSLEEAGKLPLWSIDFIPTLSVLGIYPSVIGLSLQALLVIGTVIILSSRPHK